MAATVSPEWGITPSIDNRTIAVFEVAYSWTHFYIVSVFLGFLIICIICGNALVVLAVLTERHLRVVSNYLILSLAVADLLVAVIVMPLSLVHEVSKVWWLGLPLCDLWICADVLLCTASTLHLCAIAIERALAVSNLAYLRDRPPSFILIMIGICWILAAMVSLPARFHPRRNLVIPEVIYDGVCEVSMEKGFTIYSNLLAFDLPMIFTVLMYVRIYFAARKHIRKKHFSKYHTNFDNAENESSTKNNFVYQSPDTPDVKEGQQYCCYCCGYVMETKFHKGGAMFKVGLTRRSEFQCSSSSDKPTLTTTTEPPETVVAAAVTAMKIAATMIRTTKEPEWGNCDYESSGSENNFHLNTLSAVRNTTFEEISNDEGEKAIKILCIPP
nr:Amine (Serotonin 5-HT) G protein-coupled receptor [Hymenolepis microstoma]